MTASIRTKSNRDLIKIEETHINITVEGGDLSVEE